jgi:hypothetical protein
MASFGQPVVSGLSMPRKVATFFLAAGGREATLATSPSSSADSVCSQRRPLANSSLALAVVPAATTAWLIARKASNSGSVEGRVADVPERRVAKENLDIIRSV